MRFWLAVYIFCGCLSGQTLRFQFTAQCDPKFTCVPSGTAFTDAAGFGFEQGKQVLFSVRVPEGNYRVTVTAGGGSSFSDNTIKAEVRRLMAQSFHIPRDKSDCRTFVLNVRRPNIANGGEVHLNRRELTTEAWAWDDKLTLEFDGANSNIRNVTIERVDVPTVYIAGDSTSADRAEEPFSGWGQMLTAFFTPDVAVANNAEPGAIPESFVAEQRLAKIIEAIRPGDYLFIQFGDTDTNTTPGAAAMTAYKADLKRFVSETRQREATPVLITPLKSDARCQAVLQLAREEGVAVIDMNAMSKNLQHALGADSARLFVPPDTINNSEYGSYELAKCVAYGIRRAHLPLAIFLNADATFDPAHPDSYKQFELTNHPVISDKVEPQNYKN